MNLKIRKARRTDSVALVNIEEKCFSYDRLNMKKFNHFIESNTSILLVLEIKGEVIGYALTLLRKGSKRARIYSLCISLEFNGMGLGKKLFIEMVETLRKKRILKEAKLEVKVSNLGAIKLYESLGFKKIDYKKEFYSDGTDAIVYLCHLK